MSDAKRFPTMECSAEVESALYACGPDSVMFNDREPYSVAIRRDPITHPGTKWHQGTAKTHEEAGLIAAEAFADDLATRASELYAWAARIRHHIRKATAKGESHD